VLLVVAIVAFDSLKGVALLFLQGRPPKCHRCNERGHKFFECVRPYCRRCHRVGHQESDECRRSYAQTAAVEEPEPELSMDQDDENADDRYIIHNAPLSIGHFSTSSRCL